MLIIGGGGYVGMAVCQQLAEKDISFVIVDTFSAQPDAEITVKKMGWSYRTGDIRQQVDIASIIAKEQPTHIIHLAAIHFIPYCNEHPDEVVAVNIVGLQNVVSATRRLPRPCRFTFASSAAVYGNHKEIFNEEDLASPLDIYGVSKLAGESIIKSQLNNYAIARLFNVFGKHDPHAHLIPRIFSELQRAPNTLALGTATTERDFIHVDDVARALISMSLRSTGNSTYNVGSGEVRSVKEVVKAIQHHRKIIVPTTYQNAAYMRTTDAPRLCADTSKIVEDLAWRPQHTFESGLATLSSRL